MIFCDFSCPKPVILVILKFKLTPDNGREELFEFFFTNEFPVLRVKIQKTDDFCRFLFIFQEIWIFLCSCLHNSHFGVFFWDSNGSAKPTAKRTGFKISCHMWMAPTVIIDLSRSWLKSLISRFSKVNAKSKGGTLWFGHLSRSFSGLFFTLT